MTKGKSKDVIGADEDLPPLSTLALAGSFAENVTIAPRSYSTIILATGLDQESENFVLVPFVETIIHGTTQKEAVENGGLSENLDVIFSRTLPLENALWLGFDLLRDIRVASENLEKLVDGRIAFEPSRLEHARRFAGLARAEAERCEIALEAFSKGRD
jgi:hypothetical protein